jgi:site-specific DNA recombinase
MKRKGKVIRTAAYIRVSTEKQVRDGHGLEEQRHNIIEYCQGQGYEIVAWYEDAGVTGGELEVRDAMMNLLSAAKDTSCPFTAVVATKIDRLARSLYGQLFVEKELAVAGVQLIYSDQENLAGDDPMTTAFRQMMGVFAQLEKNLIKARLVAGRRAKAREGGYAGGRAPFGYTAAKGRKTLEVDAEKVKTVRRVFALHGEGLSNRAIARALNAEGHTTAEGAEWTAVQVGRVLTRRALYEGQYEYAGIAAEGQHVAILPS